MRPAFGQPVSAISPLPPGYMEAASSIGRSYGQGFANLGEGLAKGIEKYTRDKEESDMLTTQAETIGRIIAQGSQQATSQREQTAYDKMAESLSKFGSQSLAGKRATISGAMTEMSMLEKFNQAERQRTLDERQRQMDELNKQMILSNLAGQKQAQDMGKLQFETAKQEVTNRAAEAAALAVPSTRTQTDVMRQNAYPLANISAAINAGQPPAPGAIDVSKFVNAQQGFNVPTTRNISQFTQQQVPVPMGAPVTATQEISRRIPVMPSARDLAFTAAAPGVPSAGTQMVAKEKQVEISPEDRFSSALSAYTAKGGQLDMKTFKAMRDEFGASKDAVKLDPLGSGVFGVTVNGKFKDVVQPKGGEGPKLEQADKTFMMNAAEYNTQLNDLESTINKFGTYEMLSPEGSAKLEQAGYKMAILYAKIVDPASVVREGEVAMAKKYIIPLGANVRQETALKALQNQREEINRRVGLFEQINGVKVPGFGKETKSAVERTQSPGAFVRDSKGNLIPAK